VCRRGAPPAKFGGRHTFGALTAAYLWQAGDLDRDEAGELAAHSEPIDDTPVQRIEFDAAGHAR
jgi:hypothetical protein